MRQSITSRYEREADGRRIIDITVTTIEELYARFDSVASYKKKDLDEEFADYLIECGRELKKEAFLLRINLPHEESPERMDRVRSSIRHYFSYLQELERRKIKKHLSRAGCLLGLGAVLVFTSLSLDAHYEDIDNIFIDLGIEGITIAAWVSVWEAVSELIFEWGPHYQRVGNYEKIAASEVRFRKVAPPPPGTP